MGPLSLHMLVVASSESRRLSPVGFWDHPGVSNRVVPCIAWPRAVGGCLALGVGPVQCESRCYSRCESAIAFCGSRHPSARASFGLVGNHDSGLSVSVRLTCSPAKGLAGPREYWMNHDTARWSGIEHRTSDPLEVRCSIRLSYRRIRGLRYTGMVVPGVVEVFSKFQGARRHLGPQTRRTRASAPPGLRGNGPAR
jgi:hypothetical protein